MTSDQRESDYTKEYWEAATTARKQAGRECERCGIPSQEAREKYGTPLEAHHITPAKEFNNPVEAHTVENLKMLCRRCHRHEEFGTVTTEHSPETRLEKKLLREVSEGEKSIEVSEVAKEIGAVEGDVRAAAARMVSGGYIEMTVDGKLTGSD